MEASSYPPARYGVPYPWSNSITTGTNSRQICSRACSFPVFLFNFSWGQPELVSHPLGIACLTQLDIEIPPFHALRHSKCDRAQRIPFTRSAMPQTNRMIKPAISPPALCHIYFTLEPP
jgi:hypothetical protein